MQGRTLPLAHLAWGELLREVRVGPWTQDQMAKGGGEEMVQALAQRGELKEPVIRDCCGTRRGYDCHYRNGEIRCKECLAAWSRYQRDWKRKRKGLRPYGRGDGVADLENFDLPLAAVGGAKMGMSMPEIAGLLQVSVERARALLAEGRSRYPDTTPKREQAWQAARNVVIP